MRRYAVVLTVLAALAVVATVGVQAVSAAPTTWVVGDVFAGVESGNYNVYDNTGAFKETINDGDGGFTTGCAFNPQLDKLYTTNFSTNNVVVYDDAPPHAILQTIDVGANGGGNPESVVFAASGDFYVGNADGNADILRYDASGAFQQSYDVATENRGSDWIDLGADQTTMYYTSEGQRIMRYDVGTDTQLADFANLGGDTAYALKLLPPFDGSGGLLVADTSDVKRLDASGNVVQTYDVAGEDSWFSLNLDPDGTSFWAGNFDSGNLYRFDIATGAQLDTINTGAAGNLFGVCVKGESAPVTVTKDYRHTNVCFEDDNDGDGQFGEDPADLIDNDGDGLVDEDGSECPNGTNLGDLLPTNGAGAYVLKAVVKKDGTVASYNPGQYYAVSTVDVLRDVPELVISEEFGDCTDPATGNPLSKLNPLTGGGSVVIVDVGPDGVAHEIANANSSNVTISDANNNGIPDDAEADLGPVEAGHTILMYVKFGPGLKGLPFAALTCENVNSAVTQEGGPTFSATATLTLVK